jgi:cytochrome c
MSIRHTLLPALALAIGTALGVAPSLAGPPGAEDDPAIIAAGQKEFQNRCERCHDDGTATERRAYGPSLKGVFGRKAGSIEGFGYSKALKESGLVWTEEQLRAWMANNTGLLPGTRMRHVGISDPGEQDLILAYLKSLK